MKADLDFMVSGACLASGLIFAAIVIGTRSPEGMAPLHANALPALRVAAIVFVSMMAASWWWGVRSVSAGMPSSPTRLVMRVTSGAVLLFCTVSTVVFSAGNVERILPTFIYTLVVSMLLLLPLFSIQFILGRRYLMQTSAAGR
ncbi:MAG: hypothetical protein WAZ48_01640 [Lysobacteraceae bacterium]